MVVGAVTLAFEACYLWLTWTSSYVGYLVWMAFGWIWMVMGMVMVSSCPAEMTMTKLEPLLTCCLLMY